MSATEKEPLHAVALGLAVDPDGPLAGVLLLGPSGSGKSSLALLAIEACPYHRTALVADDAVIIENGAARAPAALSGFVEIRGFGPARIRHQSAIRIRVALSLADDAPRTPERGIFPSGDRVIPLLPFRWRGVEATAAARMRQICREILSGQTARARQDAMPGAKDNSPL